MVSDSLPGEVALEEDPRFEAIVSRNSRSSVTKGFGKIPFHMSKAGFAILTRQILFSRYELIG